MNVTSGILKFTWWERRQKHGHDQDPAYEKVIPHASFIQLQHNQVLLHQTGGERSPHWPAAPPAEKYQRTCWRGCDGELAGISSSSSIPKTFLKIGMNEGAGEREMDKKMPVCPKRLDSTVERRLSPMVPWSNGIPENRMHMAKIALRFPLTAWMEGLNIENVYFP